MKHLIPFWLLLICSRSNAQQYPDNIYADTAYAPFLYGVASGDPLQDRVIIWTKIEPTKEERSKVVSFKWQVAEDSTFSKVVQKGETAAFGGTDFTSKTDVVGLQPGHRYFYRFIMPDGKISQTGKAQTLPVDSVKDFNLAVVSCASIWAGYFNAYRRIADRDDIDFVIHLGDYVYDYADKRQLKRMPAKYPKDVSSLEEWRERHTYYLLDPDLRAARQNKTWIAEWDNHDTDCEKPGTVGDAIRAFYEYLPIRVPNENDLTRIYRSFHFGNLADLIMIDMHLFRGKEEYAEGKKCVLGLKQDAWMKSELLNSKATWKLIGNQEMMNDWLSEGAPKFVQHGNGHVFDESNWNGFPEDRQRIFDFIDSNKIRNTVVLTGDIHMSFVMDMTGTPKDPLKYNPKTGEGAVGVELTGPSISRINMKDAGVPAGFIPLIQRISRKLNPHHLWCQFSKHGYFTLQVSEEKCLAEYWYSNIKRKTRKETFGKGFTVERNTNHWDRKINRRPSSL